VASRQKSLDSTANGWNPTILERDRSRAVIVGSQGITDGIQPDFPTTKSMDASY
jgi:hypothetical protein